MNLYYYFYLESLEINKGMFIFYRLFILFVIMATDFCVGYIY